ncbi:hypothetical protein [Bifidobacterium panos]|uniref:GTPase n=1 Tax=Bifidobacterium panos TaxID=2675321 RepID=A0ABX1SZC5_9BIFI|nr:hypothetical protein [Bifidobacterium sp. DSM 109963]NMN02532.1 hypothetical protein [Bifidobacterium sp. DSM 109963]
MSFEDQTDETEPMIAERPEHGDDAAQQDSESAEIKRKNRHRAKIMRGVVTPILGLLAVAAIVLGALNATIWKPSRVITATAQVAGEQYIVTDANVEGLVDSHVKVDVEAKHSDTVCVALAASKDAAGWLGNDAYARLTGLSDWTTLSVEKVAARSDSDSGNNSGNTGDSDSGSTGDSSSKDSVSFQDSDMWRSVQCGNGKASIETQETNSTDVVFIDLGKATDSDVSFEWTRQVLPDFAMPMYFVGGLLAVAAVLTASVFAMPPSRRRKRAAVRGEAQPADDSAAEAGKVTVGQALAGSLSGFASLFGPKPKRRRRHAAGRAAESAAESAVESATENIAESAAADEETSQPVIVDPASRNLVADAADAADAAEAADAAQSADIDDAAEQTAAEETAVISPEELQAYFARLAQEIEDDAADEAQSETVEAEQPDAPDNTSVEPGGESDGEPLEETQGAPYSGDNESDESTESTKEEEA